MANVIIAEEVIAEERSPAGYELRLIQVEILSTPLDELPIVISDKNINAFLDALMDSYQKLYVH